MALAGQIEHFPTNGGRLRTDNVPQFPPDIQAPNRCKRAMGHFPFAQPCTAKFSLAMSQEEKRSPLGRRRSSE